MSASTDFTETKRVPIAVRTQHGYSGYCVRVLYEVTKVPKDKAQPIVFDEEWSQPIWLDQLPEGQRRLLAAMSDAFCELQNGILSAIIPVDEARRKENR